LGERQGGLQQRLDTIFDAGFYLIRQDAFVTQPDFKADNRIILRAFIPLDDVWKLADIAYAVAPSQCDAFQQAGTFAAADMFYKL
jgi:hypothetical protein